jgi:ATP-dependent protease La (LON) substrate-binding domain/Zinc finger, C3HC4 type (RING finger)
MSSNEEQNTALATVPSGLSAHEDARAIVRLVQCSQCSYPLREPMTLPCGHSICRPCLPPIYKRENITYPPTQGRSEGFVCPFRDCGLEHSLGDCSTDVTLSKLLEVVKTYMSSYRAETSETPLQLDERLNWPHVAESSIEVMPRSRVLHGGRIVATYVFADMGELNYHSDVAYTPVNEGTDDSINALDVAVLENLKEATKNELECQVCYAVILDPLTTSCGHTFCRRCLARVVDHSNLCPICRRRLPLAPGVQGEPSNKRITYLVGSLLADALAARIAAIEQEDAIDEDASMPLFPCTLAFPMMPTFLHIFEPRYRLMIRRVIENGTRKFGMMMYNQHRYVQGTLGQVQFMQYGTILHVDRIELLPDGRSLIESRGMSRFKVLEARMQDGYNVGRIQRIEDISIAEEEAIEVRETSREPPPAEDYVAQLDYLSTQRLLDYGLDFIAAAQARSAPWLHRRMLQAYGQPPTDPALFPYWFASILPIAEAEKYQLLPTTSVRDRLKITARWVQRLEAARW